MMRRRYDAYRDIVVRPFFRDHFARLDRQIVLVDTLAAINAGPDAVFDLERALAQVLDCFQIGRKTVLSTMLRPRIDRILLAATKADHLHHTSHDRLEAVLKRLTQEATAKAELAGAQVDVVALAAVRATREAMVWRARQELPCILGVPVAGEVLAGKTFDGETEAALFPGDLPDDPNELFRSDASAFRGIAADLAAKRRLSLPARAAAAPGGDGQRRASAASHSPRPRAAIPDRRLAAMSKNWPHRPPAVFRLDDDHVMVGLAKDDAAKRAVQVIPEPDTET